MHFKTESGSGYRIEGSVLYVYDFSARPDYFHDNGFLPDELKDRVEIVWNL